MKPMPLVLHIEDDEANQRLVDGILKRARTKPDVLFASHGRDGVKLARKHEPNLILLDLGLPDISGEEVLSELKTSVETATTPVIVLSGEAHPDDRDRLLAAGTYAYLVKPIDVVELLSLVDELLG